MAHPRTPIEDLRLAESPNLARALRRAPLEEKTFEAGVPDAPESLTVEERKVWDRVVELLSARGTLTPGDGFAVEKYCKLYVRWRTEEAGLAEEGTVIEVLSKLGKDHNGVYVRVLNPRLKIVQATEKQLLALDMELGLTPRHRGKPGQTTKRALSLEQLLHFPGSAS